MSLEKKSEEDVDQFTSKPKNNEEAVASQYALHVALQTMKERCQHLQQRLSSVEQENLRLRIENRKRKSDFTCSRSTEESQSRPTVGDLQQKIDDLEEKVAELQRTKSYLTHHLYMVATENKQLWNRLSCLKQDNQNLGSHLSKISNTLSRHHSTSSIILSKSQSPTNSLSQGTNKDLAKEPSSPFTKTPEGAMDESLQEISLKLIKSFLQEKTELEEQYAQMVEIQSDSYSIGLECLEDGDESVEDLKLHHKNLVKLRDQMLQQQTAMKTALANLQQGVKGGQLCSNCKAAKPKPSESNVELEAEMESLRQWGTPDDNMYSRKQPDVEAMTEKICPMCGKLYNKEIPFSSFQQHVSDHFADDEDSYSIINNFEVVT